MISVGYVVTDDSWSLGPWRFLTQAEADAFVEADEAAGRPHDSHALVVYEGTTAYCHECDKTGLCVRDDAEDAWGCYQCGNELMCDECGQPLTPDLTCTRCHACGHDDDQHDERLRAVNAATPCPECFQCHKAGSGQ